MNQRSLFLSQIAQTSPAPMGLEIVRADGIYLYGADGKQYIDLIAGFSVSNIGHGNAAVKAAIKQQVDDYMHLMVYGELIQSPQVQLASRLIAHLPSQLNCVYFTNSGAEAAEGAMKLAKRITNRSNIIAFNKAYHGSTQGALSAMGDEYFRNAYRPLLPGIRHFDYNSEAVLAAIDAQTACVLVEPVQAESGICKANKDWLLAIRKKCDATGALLIFDEIQAGFGRTGSLWAFQQYEVVPDVLLLGKALGGGMPLGAFVSAQHHMQALTHNPVLGHITTFGGHPVCCAAGLAAFNYLLSENIIPTVAEKEQQFLALLQHPAIQTIRHAGLWMALEFASNELAQKIVHRCVALGAITDWFLFAGNCLRIAPPLTISPQQIDAACQLVLQAIDEVVGE
jgi:acetylornithine/N-succinyldiaminopimelate aminotransferase